MDMPMDMHLYDFRWINEREAEFQAIDENRLKIGKNPFGRKRVKIGDSLSLKIIGEVACAGSFRDKIWKPCPESVVGKKKCEMCRNREGNFIFTSFDGFNTDIFSAEDLFQIQGEHWVYLALFEKNLIKVGVSKLDRKSLRQLEQGSHFTLFIAKTPDGTAARQIETLLRQHGISDKILSSHKKDFLCPEITETEGREVLEKFFKIYRSKLEPSSHLHQYFLENPEFFNWENFYGIPEIPKSAKKFYTTELKLLEAVSGKILAMKGAFLVLETDDALVSICAKGLLGHTIDFTPAPFGLKLESARQDSLF